MHERSLRVLVDTNVLIAAVKGGWSKSTELLVKLFANTAINLVANRVLIYEYSIYTKKLNIPQLLSYILPKMLVIAPSKEQVTKCQKYFSSKEYADVLHAATCLASKAILISNDKDFNAIKKSKIIKVWTISNAIKQLL